MRLGLCVNIRCYQSQCLSSSLILLVVSQKLGLEIPPFLLKRRVRISAEKTEGECSHWKVVRL